MHVYSVLEKAAKQMGHKSLRAVAIEVNDPKTTDFSKDNGNTVQRLNFWKKYGYRIFEFPYSQPALSSDKSAVSNLLLLGYFINSEPYEHIDSIELKAFIKEYFSSGSWNEEIENNKTVTYIFDWLTKHSQTPVIEIDYQ